MRSIISNIGDCFTDPGELTPGQARRAMAIHNICSPSCRILQQAKLTLDGAPVRMEGLTPQYSGVELIGYGEVSTGYLH
ncbi:hypothetical protein ACIBJI_10325 [Nocardia sp. NPDC050408]|uniref:hypothetical protein n=1 Tax=unclassified Nocardia TaxID=2637762 RepID=UPI003416BE9D